MALSAVSCSFDTDLTQNIDTPDAYDGVQDVKNGMIGAYYSLGHYGFLGNYATAIGDFAGGLAQGSPNSGHFVAETDYTLDEYNEELEYIWAYGYQVVDRTVRTINGANGVLANATSLHLTDADKAELYSYKSQCFGLRALANFYLANIFCYPYSKGTANKGLPIFKDKPVEAFQKATRASLGDTYEYILEDIDSALVNNGKAVYENSSTGKEVHVNPNEFYMNDAAINALKARVLLYMGKYAEAEAAAKKALSLKSNGENTTLPSNDIYLSNWASITINDEDIFTISKTESDNLSANALNTLYGSYNGTLTSYCQSLFSDKDIRKNLIGTIEENSPTCLKWQGLSTSQSVSNIPVFRKSEMYLVIAECEARVGSLQEAVKYVSYTAKRDTGLDLSTLSSKTKDELLDFIWNENAREFFGEGHFYYDARRLDKTITVNGGKSNPFKPAGFVYPIPGSEINAGFMTEQNEDWSKGLPTMK